MPMFCSVLSLSRSQSAYVYAYFRWAGASCFCSRLAGGRGSGRHLKAYIWRTDGEVLQCMASYRRLCTDQQLSNRLNNRLNVCSHDAAGCSIAVVKPHKRLATANNRLNICIYDAAGCPAGCQTGTIWLGTFWPWRDVLTAGRYDFGTFRRRDVLTMGRFWCKAWVPT